MIPRAVVAALAGAFVLAAGVRLWNALRDGLMWGYDAWGHVAYVLYLDLYRAVPFADQGWSYYQPPLHYALGALLARAGDTELLVRGLSLLGGAASLAIAGLAAWLAASEWRERPWLAVVAFGAVAFLPVHLTVGQMPGNEMTVGLLNTTAIALLVANERRDRPSRAIDLALGLALGLAALAKHTGLVAWLAVASALLVSAGLASAPSVALRRLALRGAAIGIAALAVAGPHYLHNLTSYGKLIPSNRDYPLEAEIEAAQPPGERHLFDYLRLSPAVLLEPNPLAPHMLHSVWGSLYTNLWSDTHRESELGRSLEAQHAIRPAAIAMIWLGLLPTGLALAGAACAAGDVARGRRRETFIPLFALSLAMLGAFAVFVWLVPRWAAVKASYCLSLSLPFALFLCRGIESLRERVRRTGHIAVLVWLLVTALAAVAVGTAGLVLPVRRDAPAAGAVRFYFGEYEEARHLYAWIAERTRYAAPWYENMAAVALAQGAPERAVGLYRAAIRLAEREGLGDPRREARLAAALAVGGDVSAARALLASATRELASPDLLANRGALALAAGDLEAARADLSRAVDQEPWLEVAWRHLAEVRARDGDAEGAGQALSGAARAACLAPRGYPYGVGTGEILEWGVGRRPLLRVRDDRVDVLLAADLRDRCGAEGGAPQRRASSEHEPFRHLLIVSLDTLSALHSSAYGYPRETSPELERIAAGGVLFENAYTPQVWTLTAHLSLMTGVYPQVHGASERRAANRWVPTLSELLRERGFATASFTGTGGYMDPRFGHGRGFERYEIGSEDAAADNRDRLAWLAEQARRAARDPAHRFFLFAHYFDVHSDVGGDVPYEAPEPVGRRFVPEVLAPGERWARRGDTQLLIDLERSGDVSERDRAMLAALYDAGALYADEVGLGALWSALQELDLLDDTLVVVTSDHGEELFQHGKGSHQQPYEETARVPLVFHGPGLAAGLRPRGLVSLVDVMPTVLSLLGLDAPDTVQGRDLSSILRGESDPPGGVAVVDGLHGGLPHLKWRYPSSITREKDGVRWSYVNTVYDREEGGVREFFFLKKGELYQIDEDPTQQRDVRDEHLLMARELKRELLDWYEANDALARRLARGSAEPAKPLLDAEEASALEALGYVE